MDGPVGLPIQRAVKGGSGWIIGPDYRGVQVLAAYTKISGTDWGIVAKLDMSEVRRPFVGAGAVAALTSLALVLLATLLFMRISSPIIRHLEESSGQMQAILDSAGDGILGLDSEGRFTFVNRAAARMLSWPAEELIGKPGHATVHHSRSDGTPYPESECEVCSTLKDGELRREVEGAYWRRNGTWFPVARTVNALRRGDRVVGLVVTFRDVTERKKAELDLQLAQYELKKRNTEMEQFIYTVSHDLKSPLVTMQGFASHLRADIAKQRFDRTEDFVQRINNAADRMKRLIDELLELSRIGRFVAAPERIGVSDLVREIADRYQDQIAEKGVTVSIEPDMPTIDADRNRMNQAFENLLVNALKYATESPQPRIEIGARREGDELRFFVRDNGPGIAQEYHERIFQLFQRLDSRGAGTGVGLAIVKRVLEFHGGRVWVESAPGQGATFWLAIPQKSPTAKRTRGRRPQKADRTGDHMSMTPRPLRFLLIEDDDDHAELIRMALTENHVVNKLDRVADGAAAIEYLTDGVKSGTHPRPDVILLDLKLPKVDGHDVLLRVKQDPVLRTIPVVILTTSQAEVDRVKAYANHANSYLSKPVDFEKFHQMIKDLKMYWSVWNQPPPDL